MRQSEVVSLRCTVSIYMNLKLKQKIPTHKYFTKGYTIPVENLT